MMDIFPKTNIFAEILAERVEQDAQWGGPDHDDTHTIGEWRADITYQASKMALDNWGGVGNTRERLIKIAALAFAAIESIDRRVKTK